MKVRNCSNDLVQIVSYAIGNTFNVPPRSGDCVLPFPHDILKDSKISNVGSLQFIPENDTELMFLLQNPIFNIPSEIPKKFQKRPAVVPL